MLHYAKMDVREGIIDVNKTSASKKCVISHYRFFQIVGLGFNQLSSIGIAMY